MDDTITCGNVGDRDEPAVWLSVGGPAVNMTPKTARQVAKDLLRWAKEAEAEAKA